MGESSPPSCRPVWSVRSDKSGFRYRCLSCCGRPGPCLRGGAPPRHLAIAASGFWSRPAKLNEGRTGTWLRDRAEPPTAATPNRASRCAKPVTIASRSCWLAGGASSLRPAATAKRVPTVADQVGACTTILQPLYRLIDDPLAWLAHVSRASNAHPARALDDLLPWHSGAAQADIPAAA